MRTTTWLGLSTFVLGACMSIPVEHIYTKHDGGDGDSDGHVMGDGDIDSGRADGGDGDPGDGDGDQLDASDDAQGNKTCPTVPCADPSAPVCHQGACVACSDQDPGACANNQLTPFCQAGANACAECNQNSDCKTAEKSFCAADHTCQPCDPAGDDECGDSAFGHVCLEAGAAGREGNKCVQCTGTSYADCGSAPDGKAYVCDSKLNTCTQIKEKAAGLCEACLSDAMCKEGMACVREAPNGQEQGYVCLGLRTTAAPACKRPYFQTRNQVPSLDGAASNVCGLRVTSCAAWRQFSEQVEGCESEQDDNACGLPNLESDGLCREYNSSFYCTTPCASSDDCDENFACNTSETVKYCELATGTCFKDGDCKAPTPKCNTNTHACGP